MVDSGYILRTANKYARRFWAGLCLVSMIIPQAADAVSVWTNLTLVDEVICATDATHLFAEYPTGGNVASSTLGSACRVLANPTSAGVQYFAYRLGQGKGLQAGQGYVLHVEYPEDQPRSLFVLNYGCETTRGFHTGRTVGDALHPPYVFNNCESLELPLSGAYETWEQLFYLHERFPELQEPRGTEYPRPLTPDDGFWVIILQLSHTNAPLSAGAAVRRIALYAAPPFADYALSPPPLPAGLPQRHLFWREEMSDGVINSTDPLERGVTDDLTWYEEKIKLSRFLGMNTFAKDLLEFGANQGWDSSAYGGNTWVNQSAFPQRWHRIVMTCGEYGLNVLPYYEYDGGEGSASLGKARRARPLGNVNGKYTHISWVEDYNADVTDPDTLADLKKVLDVTVLGEQQHANFVGAWFRHRPSSMPIGFADPTLERFRVEANGGVAVTRANVSGNASLRQRYYDWWMGRRKQLLNEVRDYLREGVNSNQVVLYTTDSSEPGAAYPDWDRPELIAEVTSVWSAVGATSRSYADWVGENRHRTTLTNPPLTWASWEWQHSVPPPDPQALTNQGGVLFTYPFNRAYTVASPANLDAFRTESGLALVRHYSLNEDTADLADTNRGVGYFVSDVERAGPFCMMAEAMALANGSPRYIGYLASSSFNRGFPYYVRRFNQNFLALPALPGRLDAAYSGHSNLAVRVFETPSNGVYLAAVHLGRTAQAGLPLLLPEPGRVLDAVTGEMLAPWTNRLDLSLYPYEVRSFRFLPASSNAAPEIYAPARIQTPWYSRLGSATGWVSVALNARAVDWDGPDQQPLSTQWSCPDSTAVSFLNSNAPSTTAYIREPGEFTLLLTARDEEHTVQAPVPIVVTGQEARVTVTTNMMTVLYPSRGAYDRLFDEQAVAGDPPTGAPSNAWVNGVGVYPRQAILDLGDTYQLSQIWLYDANGTGHFKVYTGDTNQWTEVLDVRTDQYKAWKHYAVDWPTRYLLFSMEDGLGVVAEIVLYARGGGLQHAAVPAGQAPRLVALSPEGLQFTANALRSYWLQVATNLAQTNAWTTVQVLPATDPVMTATSGVPALTPSIFFRTIEVE